MNIYLQTLENDINRVQDLSHMCRGEWCRSLESEVDGLFDEVVEMKINEGDFESSLVEELATRLNDAYRHLAPDFRT